MRRLLHYRLILLHYQAVITLICDYYIIGCNTSVENITSHSALHSSTTRKPSTCTWNSWKKSTPTARWQSPTQRKQHDQHQERCTTGRYHIAQAIHRTTRMHIPMTDLGSQRLEDARWICLTRQIYMRTSSYDIKMERSMLNVTYRERKTNTWVREKTKVTDVIE